MDRHQLAALSDDDLAAYYFSELDEDIAREQPATLAFAAEAERRGLTHEQLLALWNREHDVA